MDLPGYTINNVHSGYPDASEAKISSALTKLSISFQEGDSFTAYLRQLSKFALLQTGIVISDLSDCCCGLLDSCDSLLHLPSAWLPAHLRSFSTASFHGCIKTVTDIAAVADVFCHGHAERARALLFTDPSAWPFSDTYHILHRAAYEPLALDNSTGPSQLSRPLVDSVAATSLYPPPRQPLLDSP